MDQMTEALSSNNNSRSTISDTDEHLAVKTDEHLVAKTSPPDETVYETYAAVLASIQDAYESKIVKSQKSEQWYQERRAEANRLTQQLGGSPKNIGLPSAPSEQIVLRELEAARSKVNDLQRVDSEISQHNSAIAQKQSEIDKRNNQLTIGAIVYVIGVVIVGALSHNFVAGLLWPLIVVVLFVVLAILGLFGGGG